MTPTVKIWTGFSYRTLDPAEWCPLVRSAVKLGLHGGLTVGRNYYRVEWPDPTDTAVLTPTDAEIEAMLASARECTARAT